MKAEVKDIKLTNKGKFKKANAQTWNYSNK